MARDLLVELVTPEKTVLSERADFVVLPAFEGEMGVLPGHEPYLVQLRPGGLRVRRDGQARVFAVSGGFAEVLADKVSVFAETAEMADEIDAERARQALERARAEAHRPDADDLTLSRAETAIRRAQARLRVAGLRKGPGRRGGGP